MILQKNKLEAQHKNNPQEHLKIALIFEITKLKSLDANVVAKDILYGTQKCFEYANKPGNQLANLLAPKKERESNLYQQ